MADSGAGVGNLQVSLEHPAVPESKEVLKERWVMSEGHRSQLERAPIGQIWDSLRIR